MSKDIVVCCDTPMVWTFAFPGAEWFCRICKGVLPMFNAERVKATPELEEAKAANAMWFSEVSKDWIPETAFFSDCHKCEKDHEHHIDHATDEEKAASVIAHLALLERAL